MDDIFGMDNGQIYKVDSIVKNVYKKAYFPKLKPPVILS